MCDRGCAVRFRSSWRTHRRRKAIVFALAVALLLTSLAVYDELGGNSTLQAHNFHRLSREAGFHVAPGRSPSIRFPATGPLDQRLGYVELPRFLERLDAQGCSIASQARWSPRLSNLAEWGLFPPYREATQTGLQIRDRHGTTISAMRYPERVFQRFEDIPWLIVDTLLFIENRELFDDEHPQRNPAIEIDRLARAALEHGARLLDPAQRASGGSTLATQMEKFRHSHEGRTESVGEKLRQILSASMRSYQSGEDTRVRRKEIVLDYLNAVPLGGRPPWGEVLGLGDALWVWYGRDFAETNRLLRAAGDDEDAIVARGAAYKAVLSLIIALRRPSGLLGASSDRLEILTERYLRLLADARIIDGKLRDAALGSRLAFSRNAPTVPQESLASRKGIDAVRAQLATMLGAHRRYDVDRMDLAIDTTLDQETEDAVRRALRTFANPVQARAAGLVGERLLGRSDPAKVVYSVTLYEVRDAAFRLLVQTDSTDQPFDVNEGLKLDLGSTAKLRTLVTYLELVASLHARLADHDRETLRATRIDPDDALLRWAVDHLLHAKERSRTAMLEAAMERRYAANAAEAFFTGGGLHTFQNFRVEDDVRVVSVAEAFRESINLVFVRLLRDIALHHSHAAGAGVRDHPRHAETLARFADYEGRVFIERFYRQYRGMTADDISAVVMARQGPNTNRARLAPAGKNSSLVKSFTASASGCSKPKGPARSGPTRSCRNAAITRSA